MRYEKSRNMRENCWRKRYDCNSNLFRYTTRVWVPDFVELCSAQALLLICPDPRQVFLPSGDNYFSRFERA